MLSEKNRLEKKLELLLHEKLLLLRNELLEKWKLQQNKNVLTAIINLDNPDLLKQLSFELRKMTSKTIIALGANVDGKPMISVMFSEDLQPTESLNAVQIVKSVSQYIQGGGGGQPFYATAGGKNLNGLELALNHIYNSFQNF